MPASGRPGGRHRSPARGAIFRLLKAAQPKATLTILDSVNHLLKDAPADRVANLATYADPTLPLSPQVAPAFAGFIKAH